MRVSSGEKATEETELYEVGLRHCGKDKDRVIDRDFFMITRRGSASSATVLTLPSHENREPRKSHFSCSPAKPYGRHLAERHRGAHD